MLQKIINFFKDVRQEMAKVSWPTRDELKDSTIIVILLSVFFAIVIYAIDKVLGGMIQLLYPFE
ncbi:preprotein translocase subunit SecE [candidate division KSB1 bacterium]|nr:preprotein translocase subunit SecE [candidate division KSB1 bacterium]